MHAISNYHGNSPAPPARCKQTGPITIHCAAASAQCNQSAERKCSYQLHCYMIQETQLSLTNRATRLEASQVTKHSTISYVRYGFLLLCNRNYVRKIFDFKNAVTLKTELGVCVGH